MKRDILEGTLLSSQNTGRDMSTVHMQIYAPVKANVTTEKDFLWRLSLVQPLLSICICLHFFLPFLLYLLLVVLYIVSLFYCFFLRID